MPTFSSAGNSLLITGNDTALNWISLYRVALLIGDLWALKIQNPLALNPKKIVSPSSITGLKLSPNNHNILISLLLLATQRSVINPCSRITFIQLLFALLLGVAAKKTPIL